MDKFLKNMDIQVYHQKGAGLILNQGVKISHASQSKPEQKQYCNPISQCSPLKWSTSQKKFLEKESLIRERTE